MAGEHEGGEVTADEAVQLLREMVEQHCYMVKEGDVYAGTYDSSALSTNAYVFEKLVEAGVAEWVGEQVGRRCFIRFKEGAK